MREWVWSGGGAANAQTICLQITPSKVTIRRDGGGRARHEEDE